MRNYKNRKLPYNVRFNALLNINVSVEHKLKVLIARGLVTVASLMLIQLLNISHRLVINKTEEIEEDM